MNAPYSSNGRAPDGETILPNEDEANALERQQELARERYGYWCGPGPGGRLYVFLAAGHDPNDGAPLTLARVATPVEADLWWRGRLEALAIMVRQCVPPMLPGAAPMKQRESVWRRMTARLRRMLLGGE